MEVNRDEKNISAQEAPEKDGAWLQKENEDGSRPQGTRKKTCKGQKTAHILSEWANFQNGFML